MKCSSRAQSDTSAQNSGITAQSILTTTNPSSPGAEAMAVRTVSSALSALAEPFSPTQTRSGNMPFMWLTDGELRCAYSSVTDRPGPATEILTLGRPFAFIVILFLCPLRVQYRVQFFDTPTSKDTCANDRHSWLRNLTYF